MDDEDTEVVVVTVHEVTDACNDDDGLAAAGPLGEEALEDARDDAFDEQREEARDVECDELPDSEPSDSDPDSDPESEESSEEAEMGDGGCFFRGASVTGWTREDVDDVDMRVVDDFLDAAVKGAGAATVAADAVMRLGIGERSGSWG